MITLCCNFPYFISDIVNYCLLSALVNFARGLLILFIFSRNHCIFVSLYFFLFSSVLISVLIFIMSFHLLILELTYSCFSKSLRCVIGLFICTLSSFLMWVLKDINFPLKTVFAGSSDNFWSHLHLNLGFFFISFLNFSMILCIYWGIVYDLGCDLL
jgi:hypothetical protein